LHVSQNIDKRLHRWYHSYGQIVYKIEGGVGMQNLKLESVAANTEIINENYEKTIIYFVIKRIIDIIGVLVGIVVLSPVMLATVIAIKMDSKGPAIFSQKRVGKDGKEFKMYKFRSMIVNADEKLSELNSKNEMSGPMFKMKDDPRITKIGKFIRKTSIDELPQLFNVLKGEMSLVGPRPNLPREVAEFEAWQLMKLKAKPGLTCYWQVMGRNEIDFEDWMKLDIKYIKDRSLWVDIKLVFKTFFVLFGDKNAR
jgi:exopolysaccharide biosynthesis polyprenyl glycosylphosphotransferase